MCRSLVARASVREGRPSQGTKPMWLRRGYEEVGQRLVLERPVCQAMEFPSSQWAPTAGW